MAILIWAGYTLTVIATYNRHDHRASRTVPTGGMYVLERHRAYLDHTEPTP